MWMRIAAAVGALALAGCNSARDVVGDPNAITLRRALVDTVDAFNAAHQRATTPPNTLIGFYPCTLKATFNISATGTTTDKAGLTIGGGLDGVTITGNASREDTLTGVRGNVVEAVFATRECLPAASADSPAKETAAAARAPRAGGATRTAGALSAGGTQTVGTSGSARPGRTMPWISDNRTLTPEQARQLYEQFGLKPDPRAAATRR